MARLRNTWEETNECNGSTHNGIEESKPPSSKRSTRRRLTRVVTAMLLLGLAALVVYGGHVCVSFALVVVQAVCFGELVAVSYREAQRDTQESLLPLFRTIQWAWFAVAMAVAYSTDFLKAPMFAGIKLASTVSNVLGEGAGNATAAIADFLPQYAACFSLLMTSIEHSNTCD